VHLGQEVAVIAVLGFEWQRPDLAPWTAMAPLLAALGLFSLAWRRRARARLADPHQLKRLYPGFSRSRALARVALAAGAALMLGLALVGPVRGFTWREVERKGLDLVVCVDTSRSMLVPDMGAGRTRLERAKQEVSLLLDRLQGDRVALVGFSGDARDVAPLTRDRSAARWFLSTLSPRDNRLGGTDLGTALTHALDLFDGRSGSHEAIVLLTDGEDLEQRGLEIAAEARARGIRIFVVGMGTSGGGKIPEGAGSFTRGPGGQEVVSHLDSATLEAIAKETRGAYVSGTTPLALEKLFDRYIANLEGRTYDQGREKIPHDRYQWPLVLALLCMLGEAALSESRPRRRRTAA
jgi:Ca-activated chloride channel family protein